MGEWNVDRTTEPGILHLKLAGTLTVPELASFVDAHNKAIDSYQGADYRVWCDVSRMNPLRPDVADVFERAKVYSGSQPNFRGSAVLVAGATVAMQHHRTSVTGGVASSELISEDPHVLRAHLRTVNRSAP